MRPHRLQVLAGAHGVAEAALEGPLVEDRAGTGAAIAGDRHVGRLVHPPGRCEPQPHALVDVERAVAGRRVDLRGGLVQERPRRRELGLHDRDLALDGVVLRHDRARRPALAAAGELDVGLEQAPRDAQRHAAEAAGVEQRRADDIERPVLAPLLGHVTGRGVRVGNEQILDRVGVAAGAAQAEHVPVVRDLRLGTQEDERAVVRPPVAHVRRAVGVLHVAVRAQQPRVAAAAGEAPGPGQAVAALDPDGAAIAVLGAPRQPLARTVEHRARGVVRHRCSRRAGRHVRLVDEPADRGVGPRHRLVDPAELQQIDLLPAEASRQEQAQHVVADQGLDHLGRDFAAAVDLGTVLVDQWLQALGALDRALGRCRDRTVHLDSPGPTRRTRGFVACRAAGA